MNVDTTCQLVCGKKQSYMYVKRIVMLHTLCGKNM